MILNQFKKIRNYSIAAICLVIGMVMINKDLSSLSLLSSLKDYGRYYFTDFKNDIKEIENTFGLKIDYLVSPNFILSPWNKAPFNGEATQISDFELSRFIQLLPNILGKYPKSVISESIDRLAFSQELTFYGVPYGGTNLERTLYLTNKGRQAGFNDTYLQELFHHEMSSLLMNKFPFNSKQWAGANPKKFQYKNETIEILNAVKNNSAALGDRDLYRQGFLSKYAQSTLENDFNVYAENIFVHPETIQDLISQYPIINTKYQLVKDFYISINPDFSTLFEIIH